jgi:peptidoglycan/LPS O-acetylase OafA/YrhL
MQAKFRFIDALRGLAILAVLLVHCALDISQVGLDPMLRGLFRSGEYGVQLFFVVSAFTLFLSLERRRPDERHPTLNFFIRRLFRIAPLYWCAIVFYLFYRIPGMEAWRGTQKHITKPQILATVTFLNGWNPRWLSSIVPGGWSVAVEMGFYLLVPFLFARLRSLKAAIAFTILSLIASVALHGWLRQHCPYRGPRHGTAVAVERPPAADAAAPDIGPAPGQRVLSPDQALWKLFIYFWLPNQIPIFGLGFVLFFLFRRIGAEKADAKYRWYGWLLLIGTAVLGAAIPYHEFRYLPPHFLWGVAFVLLALGLAFHETRLLVNPFTVWLGKISFSAYLVHSPILLGTEALGDRSAFIHHWAHVHGLAYLCLLFSSTLVATMLAATATYLLIEQPGQAVGRRVIRWMERQGAPVEQPAWSL